MQTILGSGGSIGIELAKALTAYTDQIRLVSRKPERVNESDTLFTADLLDPAQLDKAVEGSEVVYVVIGFKYDLKVWQQSWPPFIDSVIESCLKHNARLVFFDNIYMYDANALNGMTEEAKINPPSKKGKVREEVAQKILSAIKDRGLTACIARAADFYGPSIQQNSVLTETVFANLAKGKAANWLMSLNCKHSYTYTPDAGEATAILGNSETAYGQIWHLPTAENPPTGKEWIEMIAREMGVKPKKVVAGKLIVRIMGWFEPVMSEVYEMLYQYDRDYVFNSDKFCKTFNYSPTSYEAGVKEIVNRDYSKA